jgi:hypothetical protein
MQNGKNFFKTTGGIVISLGVLFATVWVVSKAWKQGQKNKTTPTEPQP